MAALLKVNEKNPPLSRQDKRRMSKEAEKVIKILEPIEILFCKDIFDESIPYSYKQLYQYRHSQFTEALLHIRDSLKLRYIKINHRYFQENFASVV